MGEDSQIDGWLFSEEADLLDKYNTGVWCEVGCWKGKSTVVLAKKSAGYAVDWFKGSNGEPCEGENTLAEFVENTEPYHKNIILLLGDARKAENRIWQSVDLLFLDAEHSYEATKEVFKIYSPKVKKGGYIIFHDAWGDNGETEETPWPGVTKFVKELELPNVENVRRCAVFQKV